MASPIKVIAAKFEDLVAGGLQPTISVGPHPQMIRAGGQNAPLASRGMHVLPRSAAAAGGGDSLGLQGTDLLTPREADVLELLQDGATNAQIAHALSIGIETVRTHARNIYRKLGISSRRELARLSRPDTVVVEDEG